MIPPSWSRFPRVESKSAGSYGWYRNDERRWIEFVCPGGTTMIIIPETVYEAFGEPYREQLESKFWSDQKSMAPMRLT